MRQPTRRRPDLRLFLRRRKEATGWRSATPSRISGSTPGNTNTPARPTSGCADPSGRPSRKSGARFTSLASGDEKYSTAYANDIIASIPPGSIYFGGTDPGRFLVTGMEKSQVNADPFFLLTQNALADSTYLDYLRGMYGDRIYIPTSDDAAKCFQDYTEDAQKRLQSHQLKPGENVSQGANGKIQVSGQVAVMEINGLLAKIIFDQNPNREFYVEESFPLDWMYPYLEPHGLIMKINRQPMSNCPTKSSSAITITGQNTSRR